MILSSFYGGIIFIIPYISDVIHLILLRKRFDELPKIKRLFCLGFIIGT